MGSCFSSPKDEDAEARQRTHEIDRRLEDDYKRLRKEVKILLLGISTIHMQKTNYRLWRIREVYCILTKS
jgi:hypothetical protein